MDFTVFVRFLSPTTCYSNMSHTKMESDFRFHILYQCTIRTNSRFVPFSKHSDETVPTLLERQLLVAILLNDAVTLTCRIRYDV